MYVRSEVILTNWPPFARPRETILRELWTMAIVLDGKQVTAKIVGVDAPESVHPTKSVTTVVR
jgi:hypothetical protein